jgi:hypothetical protein
MFVSPFQAPFQKPFLSSEVAGDGWVTPTDIPASEAAALKVLYDNGGGENWTNNTNWGTSTTVNDWYGVTVAGGHVTALNLSTNNGSGDISVFDPGDLPSMTAIRLYNNLFSGDLSGWDVSSAIRIYLQDNSFSVMSTTAPANNIDFYNVSNNGMTQTNVDAFITTIWNNRANWSDATPELNAGGTNATPTGVYQDGYPAPLTSLEKIHDLINDDDAAGIQTWASIIWNGGSAP